jgi:hypothetical protein
MKNKIAVTVLSALAVFQMSASAILITTTGDPSTGTATLTIHDPIEFTIANVAAVNNIPNHDNLSFVFNEAVFSHDGTMTYATVSGLSFTYNGGAPVAIHGWRDNATAFAEELTPNDSQIYNIADAPFSFTPGDKVVLLAGTLTMSGPIANFNMFPTGNYDIFVSGQNGYAVSGYGSVIPEPGTMALFGISAAGLFIHRRSSRKSSGLKDV